MTKQRPSIMENKVLQKTDIVKIRCYHHDMDVLSKLAIASLETLMRLNGGEIVEVTFHLEKVQRFLELALPSLTAGNTMSLLLRIPSLTIEVMPNE